MHCKKTFGEVRVIEVKDYIFWFERREERIEEANRTC